jgi:hypothetical protein
MEIRDGNVARLTSVLEKLEYGKYRIVFYNFISTKFNPIFLFNEIESGSLATTSLYKYVRSINYSGLELHDNAEDGYLFLGIKDINIGKNTLFKLKAVNIIAYFVRKCETRMLELNKNNPGKEPFFTF